MRRAAGQLRDRITIERPIADDSFDGSGSGNWEVVALVRANVEDILPSRAERIDGGINLASRPANVLIRYRPGIDAGMRFVMGNRVMEIIAGPAMTHCRRWLQFRVEDHSTAGGGA